MTHQTLIANELSFFEKFSNWTHYNAENLKAHSPVGLLTIVDTFGEFDNTLIDDAKLKRTPSAYALD